MSKTAVDYAAGILTTAKYGVDTYDSTKFMLGSKMIQSNGGTPDTNFFGPPKIGFARPYETGGIIPAQMPSAVTWVSATANIDWVFFADQAAAAATRRVQLYTYNRTTSAFTYMGFITVGFPYAATQGTYVVAAHRAIYDQYITGTASMVGTATVTGAGTAWATNKISVGSRIGFGSTDPNAITRWYEISAVGGEGTITLTESATIVSGPYIIEELRIAMCLTNGTTVNNGGTFLVKGLRFENFSAGGTAIIAATTVENVRATFWIGEAATSTDIAPIGADILKTDLTTQHLYVISTVANPILYKYNLRGTMTTITAGKCWDAAVFVLKSGAYGALSGTPVQTNNFTIAPSHSTAGITYTNCAFFTTATKIYRTIDVTSILSGSIIWAGENVNEIPPGNTTTFAATGTLKQIAFEPTINRFLVTTGGRMYCTAYYSDSTPWDRIFFTGNTMTRQISSDNADTTPSPSYTLGVFFYCVNNGMLYLAITGLTAITNFVYAIPVGCDAEYTNAVGAFTGSKQCLITPEILTPNVSAYVRAYFMDVQILGARTGGGGPTPTGYCLGTECEPIFIWYRTSGISDDSGAWTLLPVDGGLSGISPAASIQFRFGFKVMGATCIPALLTSLGVVYEAQSTDAHFQPSVGVSSIASKQFAWRFATAFTSVVPRLKIQLYDAVTGDRVVLDDSTTVAGTWEKSLTGTAPWTAWVTGTADKTNETTYLRFTPTSLGDNIRVRALLTLY